MDWRNKNQPQSRDGKKEKETAHDLICQSGYQWNWQLLMISLLNEVADRIQKCTGGFCLCFQPEA